MVLCFHSLIYKKKNVCTLTISFQFCTSGSVSGRSHPNPFRLRTTAVDGLFRFLEAALILVSFLTLSERLQVAREANFIPSSFFLK